MFTDCYEKRREGRATNSLLRNEREPCLTHGGTNIESKQDTIEKRSPLRCFQMNILEKRKICLIDARSAPTSQNTDTQASVAENATGGLVRGLLECCTELVEVRIEDAVEGQAGDESSNTCSLDLLIRPFSVRGKIVEVKN